jgi:hypothetical protein
MPITCPNCHHSFEPNDAYREAIEKELNQKAEKWKAETEKKNEQKLQELERNLKAASQQERETWQQQIQVQATQAAHADVAQKLELIEKQKTQTEQKLKEAREKEVAAMEREQHLKTQQAEMELKLKQQSLADKEQLADQLKQQSQKQIELLQQDYALKERQYKEQLEQAVRAAEEMQRKAAQGSMQLQGEVMELELEKILAETFIYDEVKEVKKGAEGADCILQVRTPAGALAGTIIFESKRAKNWSEKWIDKLKDDQRSSQAEAAVLVTQVYPKEVKKFGEYKGILLCQMHEVLSLVALIRQGLLRLHEQRGLEQNKGDKMTMLYNYLTSNNFKQELEAMVEALVNMNNGILKERATMEKIWKEREKQVERAVLSLGGVYGSLKGIAGTGLADIPLLEGG